MSSRLFSGLIVTAAVASGIVATSCGGLGLINGGGLGSGCTTETYIPNYANALSSDELLHWRRFPVRVHFTVDQHWTPQRQQNAIAGFNRWIEATTTPGGEPAVSYEIVESGSQANITVQFLPQSELGGNTVGTTTVTYRSDHSLIRASIRLSASGISGGPYSNSAQRSTAAHEFGHSLGIMGHSPFQNDVMFSSSSRENVTTNDINTLYTAYCGQFLRSREIDPPDEDAAGSFKIECGPDHVHP